MRNLIKYTVLSVLSIFIAACGSSSSDEETVVRIVHGSPDAPNVDVLVDGEIVARNVPYNVASGYLQVESGTRNFKVNATGTDITVIDVDVPIDEGVPYTIVASDFLASITPLVLVDNRRISSSGNTRVRAVHNAVSAQTVDIYVTAPDADIEELEPTLSSVPYTGVSDYLDIPASDFQVRATIAGTKLVIIDSGILTLNARSVYTIFAQDAVGGGAPFQFLVAQDR